MADGVSNRSTAFTLATGTTTPAIYGSVTLFASLTLSGTGALTFAGQGATQSITSAGISFTQPLTINSPTGTITLVDNTTIGATLATTLTAGTLNINGKAYSTGTFANTGTATRAISFGASGKITIAGSGSTAWNASGSGFTNTGTSATIDMTSASAKTFVGGGYTYAAKIRQGGTGNLTISGNNTFDDIANDNSAACTIILTAGTTNTFTSFSLAGASGKLVTLKSSSAGNIATVSKASGVVDVSYISIQDISAVGGANWSALTSNGNVNVSGNTGWIFDLGKTWIVKARRRAIR